MDTYEGSGGKLSPDTVVQLHAVVARMCALAVVAETDLGQPFVIDAGRVALAVCNGKEDHIPEVAASGTGEVGVSKAVERVVIVVVTGACIPALPSCLRAQLNHSQRSGSTGECVSVKSGPDEWIDHLIELGRIRSDQFFSPTIATSVEQWQSEE